MTRPLGLHHHAVKEIGPLACIEIAAACGYDRVSLFTQAPRVTHTGNAAMFVYPTVTEETKPEILRRLAAHGLGVTNAEFFLMTADVDLATYEPGLALGRELGARHAMTHVIDTEKSRAVDTLGAFSLRAAAHGLKLCIEFCPMTPGCRTIQDAAWFIDQTGSSNIGVNLCPMHFIRGGSTPEIAKTFARYVINAQINDGHGLHMSDKYLDEVHNRELPGDGDFPLQDILAALAAETPVEVKIPCDRRVEAGISAQDYAAEAYTRSRALLDRVALGAIRR